MVLEVVLVSARTTPADEAIRAVYFHRSLSALGHGIHLWLTGKQKLAARASERLMTERGNQERVPCSWQVPTECGRITRWGWFCYFCHCAMKQLCNLMVAGISDFSFMSFRVLPSLYVSNCSQNSADSFT